MSQINYQQWVGIALQLIGTIGVMLATDLVIYPLSLLLFYIGSFIYKNIVAAVLMIVHGLYTGLTSIQYITFRPSDNAIINLISMITVLYAIIAITLGTVLIVKINTHSNHKTKADQHA